MADTKISALTAASAVAGANEIAINEAGTSKKVTVTQITTFIDSATQTLTNKTINGTSNTIASIALTSLVNTPRFLFSTNQTANSTYNIVYQPIMSNGSIGGQPESISDLPVTFGFQVTRVRCNLQTNTLNATTTVAFRDDGSSIGALTITSGTAGEFDSGALTNNIAAASECNFLRDTTTSVSGSRGPITVIAECTLVA